MKKLFFIIGSLSILIIHLFSFNMEKEYKKTIFSDNFPLEIKIIVDNKLIEVTQSIAEVCKNFQALAQLNKYNNMLSKDTLFQNTIFQGLYEKFLRQKEEGIATLQEKYNLDYAELVNDAAHIASFLSNSSKALAYVENLIRKEQNSQKIFTNEKEINSYFTTCTDEGYEHICRFLVEKKGIAVNVRDASGDTPLHCAIRKDHKKIIKYLLDKGADPSILNAQKKMAFLAYENNLLHSCEFLLNCGVSVNIQDVNGNTPLHHAIEQHNFDLCSKLLGYKETSITIPNHQGKTALDFTKKNKKTHPHCCMS